MQRSPNNWVNLCGNPVVLQPSCRFMIDVLLLLLLLLILICRHYNPQMIREYDYLFKIVIVGNSSVGKSSLLRRFADDQFQESYLATIGVDFRFKSMNISGDQVKLQIWDTAGQERFRTITSAYYKGAHGIIMVYDLTTESSFNDITDFWAGEIEKYGEQNVVIAIAGNKRDQEEGKFNNQPVIEYCKQRGYEHMEVSAKTGDNVDELFKQLAINLTKVHPKIEKKEAPQNAIVAKVLQKKNEFKLKSGTTQKTPQKKKCC